MENPNFATTAMNSVENTKPASGGSGDLKFFDADHNSDVDSAGDSTISSIDSNCTAEVSSPPGLRRRKSANSKGSDEVFDSNPTFSNPARKLRFLQKLKEIDKKNEKLEKFRGQEDENESIPCSEIINEGDEKDRKGNERENEIFEDFRGPEDESNLSSTITVENGEKVVIEEDVTVVNSPVSSPASFLFWLAGLVIQAVVFQVNIMVSLVTFPVWLMHSTYMFLMDPFQFMRRGRRFLMNKVFGICEFMFGGVKSVLYGWIKRNKGTWELALRVGWGLLWSTYVGFVLVVLLVWAFLFSGIVIKYLVEEPIQIKEPLNFDYTKDSPVAFVPIMSCPELTCDLDCNEKIGFGNSGETRVIPSNHKLQVTVSLTLPESDYNRNLGIFLVRVDFLSANGKALASLRQPCMLQFKSQPVRLLSTFFKMAPLITGYLSETQTLDIKFKGFVERDIPTSCLRVAMEKRAEFRPGAGIPEIYAASLNLESEIPLPKRILWSWKGTIFVWTSITTFTIELLFALIFCNSIIIPQVRRTGAPPDSSSSQKVTPPRTKQTMD